MKTTTPKDNNDEKEYLYCVLATDQVATEYWIKAKNDAEAIQKCIDGNFLDCKIVEVYGSDCEDPIIVSKNECT